MRKPYINELQMRRIPDLKFVPTISTKSVAIVKSTNTR